MYSLVSIFKHTYIIIIFLCFLWLYYYVSRKIETFVQTKDDIDRTDPDVIRRVLNTNNYDSEKVKVSYTLNTAPTNSMRYFLDEHRSEFIDDVPFSPHIILKSYADVDLSRKIKVKDDIDDIDSIDDHIASLNRDDYCIKNKHLPECIKAERQFKCFGKIEFTEKECTAETDLIGNRVAPGVWDRRCVADGDCPFFKANKNYPNTFGKCIAGLCELPTGIKRVGYRQYDKNTLPLCYNCTDEKTNKNIKAHCCEKQHRPDYVFENDVRERYKYRKELSEKGLSTTMNDNYDKEFRLLEKKLKI
jgi:hypothetical protein